ncbi:MAG TPA: DUF4190 domain-containing protein [Candidatus Dormibacteraeota bacterium]
MEVPSTPKSSHATRALVLGLLSLPFGLFAPFAIWAALSSLRRIRKSNGALTGKTSAVFGLVAGILGMTALLVGTVYWFLAP